MKQPDETKKTGIPGADAPLSDEAAAAASGGLNDDGSDAAGEYFRTLDIEGLKPKDPGSLKPQGALPWKTK